MPLLINQRLPQFILLLLLCVFASSAMAAIGGLKSDLKDDDESSEEWRGIRTNLFQARPIDNKSPAVQIDIPRRAEFGATVPVAIRAQVAQSPQSYIRKMYLVVDKNPSAIAAVYTLAPDIGQADLETRIRVNEYSHVRVIAEMNDGKLSMASKYVKVSGGCSAPPNKDAAEHKRDLGKIKWRLPEKVFANQTTPVQMQVSHPNNTGFEMDHITVMTIPPHYVSRFVITYAGKPVLSAETDYSISENPYIAFNFVPKSNGELKAEIFDSKEMKFEKSATVKLGGP
ncbi:MAG: quinoprotein dehydrogenase-associated SoxYZ-like carrier [Burkholderiales bacterium]